MRQLVGAFYDAYNSHDVDAAVALYAPDGEHREVAQGSVRRGREQLADGLRGFLRAFPDAHWRVRDTLVDGERAAVAYTLSGTLREDLGPFRAGGQELALDGVHLLAARDGTLVSSEDFWDSGTFARQMREGRS